MKRAFWLLALAVAVFPAAHCSKSEDCTAFCSNFASGMLPYTSADFPEINGETGLCVGKCWAKYHIVDCGAAATLPEYCQEQCQGKSGNQPCYDGGICEKVLEKLAAKGVTYSVWKGDNPEVQVRNIWNPEDAVECQLACLSNTENGVMGNDKINAGFNDCISEAKDCAEFLYCQLMLQLALKPQ